MKQKRTDSFVLWGAVVALIAFLLGNYGLYDYIGMNEESFQTFTNLMLAVLIAFGIINNPTEKAKL